MAMNSGQKPISSISLGLASDELVINEFNNISSLAKDTPTDVITYTVPANKEFYLMRVDGGGNNIAEYDLLVDGNTEAKKRTWFGGSLNVEFNFDAGIAKGLKVDENKIIKLRVQHRRNDVGDFEARIFGILKG